MSITASEILSLAQSGAPVAVLGMGISNRPLVDFLLAHRADVTVRDMKPASELPAEGLDGRVRFVCGDGYLDNITEKLLFRSPGIRPDAGSIPAAVGRGSVLTSEMELFMGLCPAAVIGVTGSDGKSTTTTLVSLIQKAAGHRSYLGGNIGEPLLPRLSEMVASDAVAAELSSFQLCTMDDAPDTSVVTNVSPNHLNWHTDMDEYIAAKARIFGRGCRRGVFNLGNAPSRALGVAFAKSGRHASFFTREKTPDDVYAAFGDGSDGDGFDIGALVWLDGGDVMLTVNKPVPDAPCVDPAMRGFTGTMRLFAASDVLLPAAHNLENYMAAICATFDRAADIASAAAGVARTFGGVRHRLELVAERGGVRYYNSSIDSSPTRTAAAIDALSSRRIVVICGGYDKHIPFGPLAATLYGSQNVAAVVLTGATAQAISDALDEYTDKRELAILRCDDFDGAFALAASAAKQVRADAVLLSPACASFDAFKNFEERGDRFRALAQALPD